jgi:2-(1,2-epoxy-1,2-dihydrophenyl)acetyl-CoA isomerase
MDSIIFEEKEGVGVITLNRPEVFNSFNREMALAFQEALDYCDQTPGIRCVYITGNGKAFCAGQDLKEVVDPNGPELTQIVAEHYNPIIYRIRHIMKPVVVGVNGVAAGAGANIALACDVVIASDAASFIQAFSKIGLIPDSGGTYSLPRLAGMQKASAWMMLGDKIEAAEAERFGLVYRVFPHLQLQEVSWEICRKLAEMPTLALGYTKMALNASVENTLEQQLALEEKLQTLCGHSHDYQEGVQAFLEKRKPVFKGH